MSSHVWAFVVSLFCLLPLSLVPLRSLTSTCSLSWTSTSIMLSKLSIRPNAHPQKKRGIAPWRFSTLSQVMSPTSSTTSSTTSTTQRFLQQSSRMNPSTWTLIRRTRAMRNSTMSLLEKRCLHHCSFRREKNQRTWDRLITLIRKICCQLSPFSPAQVRRDPYTKQVQICLQNGNQVATQKTSESRFSLKDKKSKFLLKSDLVWR